jgi:hypothetical protein
MPIVPCLPSVVSAADVPCERRANITATTCGHARVTFPLLIPLMCGAFVVAVTRPMVRRGSTVRVRQRALVKYL